MKIKIGTRKDYIDISKLEQNISSLPWSLEELVNNLKKKEFHLVVVEDEDSEIIGYVIWSDRNDGFKIEKLVIQEKYRRSKIGSMLIDMLKKKCVGYRKIIEVIINERNLIAQLFLKYKDFKAIETIHKYWEFAFDDDAYKMKWERK